MAADKGADHLAILVHGLWGNPSHLNHLRDTLRQLHPADQLHILVARTNADNQTYDGIEVGGERIVYEVEQEIARLESEHGTKIKKLSIAGYSLGGLISRYAIGLMYSSGLFDRIEPVNFTTFATPHLGVRTPKTGYRSYMFNYMGARTLSTSGQQMFLIDSFRDTGRPLLSIMADPNSIFIKALERFRKKWVYANTVNDRSVPYYTAMMSTTDPFVKLSAVTPHYLSPQPEPGNVILDPEHYVSPRKEVAVSGWHGAMTTIRTLPIYLVLATLIPLAVPVFMMNAAYQTVRSNQRLRHHESGKAFGLERYRVKLLEEAQAVQDRVYERLAGEQTEEYLPTPPPESASSSSSSITVGKSGDEKEVKRRKKQQEGGGPEDEDSPFPTLALMKEQFEMIEGLDRVGFVKFPVHILKARHTHAAIVVRMQKESFAEGRVVSRHWVERFEL